MTGLLGPDGRPIKRASLTAPQAEPEVTGTRSVWHEPVATGLTPQRLAGILRQAAEGDMHDFLVLAEEIEEREGHYYSVLSTRRRAISELAPTVIAASEDTADVAIADKVRELVADPRFALMVADLTDALGKGFCAVEIIWQMDGKRWWPRDYKRRDPTIFRFDRRTGEELRLISPQHPDGEPLNPYTFIVHYPRLKSGLPARGGLARLAVWSFMLKAFSLKDWMAFLEVYGMPFRVGKYGPGATQAEKDALLRAVRDIAADAAAIIPASMQLEFIESKSNKGAEAFEKQARYLDEQMSKIVLGQTTTTDAISGGHAVSKEHNEVRHDILRSDARMIAATIQRDLI
jgi:phage gp29-like protein